MHWAGGWLEGKATLELSTVLGLNDHRTQIVRFQIPCCSRMLANLHGMTPAVVFKYQEWPGYTDTKFAQFNHANWDALRDELVALGYVESEPVAPHFVWRFYTKEV